MNDTGRKFATRALHGDGAQREAHNGLRFPVYSGVAFDFAKAEDMELAFTHRKPAHVYSRITNPTVEYFEQRLTELEHGLGTIALSSGMAALTTALLALLKRGDNLVASKFLFGNTFSLLKNSLSDFGIETRFVDIRELGRIAEAIDCKEKAGSESDARELARSLVSNSAGMLLVTRGIDPASEIEMYLEFEKNFIDKGLVEERFRPLVRAALRNDFSYLGENIELAADLGGTMIRLYHGMDNRLRFKCEAEAAPELAADTEKQSRSPEVFKDLRGVACPMNFVKTKVELARMQVGDFLRILLDDGEPVDNVPRSVQTEGHEVVSQERQGDHWQVVIEKK